MNSSWFCPARGERNSNEGLRSVWLPPDIPEETLRGCLVDYEQLQLKGSERRKIEKKKRKLRDRFIQVNPDRGDYISSAFWYYITGLIE